VRARVASLDPDLPVFDLATMEERLAGTVAADRFIMVVLGTFATVALLLAVVGIYGVTSYGVGQRTQEIGVRLALGAPPSDILRMLLTQSAWVAGVGLAAGVVAASFLTRFIEKMLFNIGTRDPVTLATAALLLFLVSVLACYVPARRAMRVDPAVALRHE
jgi:putative ABC transport system permease protein